MISLLAYIASHYFATGEVLPRSGNDHPIASPYGLFDTSDHPIAVAPSDDVFFRRLIGSLDLPELLGDPDFATAPLRVRHRDRLNAMVENQIQTGDAAHWIERLNSAGVPCGPVYDVAGVFSDPQVQSQDMRITAKHKTYGDVEMLGFPMKFARVPCAVHRAPPMLNEHAGEILTELGCGGAEFTRLMGSDAPGHFPGG